MYPLENQVCTLEQTKKFDELGLKLESYFIWLEIDKEWILTTNHTYVKSEDFCEYPAYSSAELDVLLPFKCTIDGDVLFYQFRQLNGLTFENLSETIYIAGYYPYPKKREMILSRGSEFRDIIPTHAKADLLLHLLKEKIVRPQDLSL